MSELTRKYYILFALILINCYPANTPENNGASKVWQKIKQGIIDLFVADNNQFDKKRFEDYINKKIN